MEPELLDKVKEQYGVKKTVLKYKLFRPNIPTNAPHPLWILQPTLQLVGSNDKIDQ
jgi:hypothetical protein